MYMLNIGAFVNQIPHFKTSNLSTLNKNIPEIAKGNWETICV